jgi:hypothetical protein
MHEPQLNCRRILLLQLARERLPQMQALWPFANTLWAVSKLR